MSVTPKKITQQKDRDKKGEKQKVFNFYSECII